MKKEKGTEQIYDTDSSTHHHEFASLTSYDREFAIFDRGSTLKIGRDPEILSKTDSALNERGDPVLWQKESRDMIGNEKGEGDLRADLHSKRAISNIFRPFFREVPNFSARVFDR